MTFHRGHSGNAKSSAISAFGSTTTWSQRSRPWVQRSSFSLREAAMTTVYVVTAGSGNT